MGRFLSEVEAQRPALLGGGGDGEVWGIENQVITGEDIDIDNSGAEAASRFSAQFFL